MLLYENNSTIRCYFEVIACNKLRTLWWSKHASVVYLNTLTCLSWVTKRGVTKNSASSNLTQFYHYLFSIFSHICIHSNHISPLQTQQHVCHHKIFNVLSLTVKIIEFSKMLQHCAASGFKIPQYLNNRHRWKCVGLCFLYVLTQYCRFLNFCVMLGHVMLANIFVLYNFSLVKSSA